MLLEGHSSVTGPETAPGLAEGVGEITMRHYAVRRRIMVVAKQLFARSGYECVSLEDVAYGADLERNDFLRHFRSKDNLLSAVLEEGWVEVLPRLADISSTSITAHSALLSMCAFMTNALQQDPDLFRLMLFEGRRPNPEAGEIGLSSGYRRFVQIWRDLVARGQRDGSFRPTYHPHVAASMLMGALEGMLRDRLVAAQERDSTPYNGPYLMQAFDALVTSLKN